MRTWTIATAVAFALAAGCGSKDVVVATVLEDDGGSGGDAPDAPPPGSSCSSNADCAPNELCAKTSCDAPTGGCEVRPLLCDGDRGAPTCGCDHVNYWNDCLRKRAGVASFTPGECPLAVPCMMPPDCRVPGASCARLVQPGVPCPPDLRGTCWVLPDACPPPQPDHPVPFYRECGGAGACTDICNAILEGTPHVQTMPGPGCM